MINSKMRDYAIHAHDITSNSKYLGFKDLISLSLLHEMKGKEKDIEYVKNNYQTLKNEVERIVGIVNKYL